jgi:hypothetical protein
MLAKGENTEPDKKNVPLLKGGQFPVNECGSAAFWVRSSSEIHVHGS